MSFLHIYSKIGTASEKNRNNAELLSFCECKNRNLRQILALETMPATFFHSFFVGRLFGLPGFAGAWQAKYSAKKKVVEKSGGHCF